MAMPDHASKIAIALRAACVAGVLGSPWRAMPAAADCLDWSDPTAEIVQGVVAAVPGAGDVSYRIAALYVGFNHHLGAVEIRWGNAATSMRQLLFHGIHDQPPATIARTGEGLAVAVAFCPRDSEICETASVPWIYDAASRRFRSADLEDERADRDCGPAAAEQAWPATPGR